jgi:methylenetetrahydrofolate reductase (NADPH)
MTVRNVLEESLKAGRFVVNLEYTAPNLTEPADDVLDLAALAARDDRVSAVAITDRVPSLAAHDPVDLAVKVAEASGKMPLVHLSGKDRTAADMRRQFERMREAGLASALVITGDLPREADGERTVRTDGDLLDSVQGIHVGRKTAPGVRVAAAVSSFKYTEAQQMMQYLKMTKKVLAGAGAIYNQVGFDLRKAQELVLYAREAALRVPLVAALYWLTPAFARYVRRGQVAGVVVTQDLAARLEELARSPDKGKAARQELLALHILLARHFGYAGVHIGGFKKADSVREILDLADEIAARDADPAAWWAQWQEILRLDDGRACETGLPAGFYVYQRGPDGLNAARPQACPTCNGQPPLYRVLRAVHDVVFAEAMERRGVLNRVSLVLGRTAATARLSYLVERASKYPLVGCAGCGSCTLPETQYVCIESGCTKRLPNGPCGGSTEAGECEGRPGQPCAWIEIYLRAKAADELPLLAGTFVGAKDRGLRGTCSWINMAYGRDVRGVPLAAPAV